MEELSHSEFLYRLSTSLVKRAFFRPHLEDRRRVLNILLDPSLPLYISGLASRVIALVLVRGHNFENCYERSIGIVEWISTGSKSLFGGARFSNNLPKYSSQDSTEL